MCVAQAMVHCNDNSINFNPMQSEESGAIQNDMANNRFLPELFEPTENEVILGRGKQIASHPGNILFKEIVLSHLQEYSAAQTKALKSSILSHIVNKIRNNSIHKAGFVKQDSETGRWNIAEDSAARIATAQIFRDALHDNYKSSKHFKQQRRNDRKSVAKKQKAVREANNALSLAQQGYNPLAFPPASAAFQLHQQVRNGSGVQDQLMGSLHNVLAGFPRTSSSDSESLSSMFEASAALPNIAVPSAAVAVASKDAKEDVVSILCNHFGTKDDSNPFEPTPISENAIIISDNQGFRLREF